MKWLLTIHILCVISGVQGCDAKKSPKVGLPLPDAGEGGWLQDFDIANRSLLPTGRNPYFILEPGYRLVFESEDAKLIITVLDDTMAVGNDLTRVVEERELKDGELVEVSRNFFAIDSMTGDVFYFGEEVDDYKNGNVSGHAGAWRAGVANAQPGIYMPGAPKVGMKYYQEHAPGIAMDRAEVVSLDGKFETPAGAFDSCLKTQEGSALKTGEKELKVYARGVGLIQDEDMLLVTHGFIKK